MLRQTNIVNCFVDAFAAAIASLPERERIPTSGVSF